MARRRSRKKTGGAPWMWLLLGLIVGAGVPAYMLWKGYLPPSITTTESARPSPGADPTSEPPIVDEPDTSDERPRYDFFTVLPEMEVVVPEKELEEAISASPDPAETESALPDGERFELQAGSFRSDSDAEQLKARLALLGVVANVQTVTVNGETWHRVRVGPVDGARAADGLRRQLADNGIETLVLKAQ